MKRLVLWCSELAHCSCLEKQQETHVVGYGEGQQVCGADPGTRIPGLRPNLTLHVSTDTSLSATPGQRSGQREQISVLSSATGSLLYGHIERDGRNEREGMMDVVVLSMAWTLCGVVMLT